MTRGTLPRARYRRAERFLPWNIRGLVGGLTVEPHWIGRSGRFWFRPTTPSGYRFAVVDPEARTVGPAFDHAAMAEALSAVLGEDVSPDRLPVEVMVVAPDRSVHLRAAGHGWRFRPDQAGPEPVDGAPIPRGAVVSPDGTMAAFVRGHDLWLHELSTGDQRPLTVDGIGTDSYAAPLPSPLPAAGLGEADGPVVHWSPDSTRILTHRIDQENCPQLPFLQSLPHEGGRPRVVTVAYPLPGDQQVPVARAVVVEVATGTTVLADHAPLPVLHYGSPLAGSRARWSASGQRAFVVVSDRGYQGYRLLEIDPTTGASRVVLAETAEVGVDPTGGSWTPAGVRANPLAVGDGTEVLWWSARDGWPHLYLYDGRSGQLRRPVTSGAWSVDTLLHVDETRRDALFLASGREDDVDPYLSMLYRVSLDGGEPQLLAPEDADHDVSVSPDGRWLVDTYSRWDQAPVTVLRDRDGRARLDVDRADVGGLVAMGWRPPRRIRVKGRDGSVDVFGLVFEPTDAEPDLSYPIVDFVYGGPQTNQAGPSFADSARATNPDGIAHNFWHAQAIAELGFVVVMLDGLGMPGRSNAFRDVAWRNLADGGIPDHIVAYPQLALAGVPAAAGQVGIFGHSAGGYASAQAILRYPEVYSVCVSSSGNHDHRVDKAVWVERYMGLPVGEHYAEQANARLADRLEGKLLLVHGDMDENVHIASTLGLVDALISANKDFDLLVMPNRPHQLAYDPYFTRVRWDYFVRHLLDLEPPHEYLIAGPGQPGPLLAAVPRPAEQ